MMGSSKPISDEPGRKEPPPLPQVTSEVAAAAALVAEADAVNTMNNTHISHVQKRGSFWMEHIARRGSHPTFWGGSAGYKVRRP